uniref:Uncharacterized protein n=1 Tax=Panagrolaimus davidi TaxID=227884 RepID=A0A914PDT4_9BILA
MTSEENNSQNVEETILKKCGPYCSIGITAKANYYALNKAVNIFLLTFLLIIVGIIGCLTWIFILAFTVDRTIELSLMIVLFVMQLVVAGIHGFFCMIAIVLDFALTLFLIILIIIVIIKNGVVINPQVRTLPITIPLTFIYIFAFLGDLNLLRFLHSYPKHWIGTKIIGSHSLYFASPKSYKKEEDNDDGGNNYVSEPVIDDYDMIEIKSAEDLANRNGPSLPTQPRLSRNDVALEHGGRQQSGMESFAVDVVDEEEDTYPEDKNPFSDEGEIISPQNYSVPVKEDSIEDFSSSEKSSVFTSDDEPLSEYLIDVQHKLSQYNLPTALTKQETPTRLQRRSHSRPMEYMAHFHEWVNQNRIMLPDGTFVVPCHQLSTHETSSSPRVLHPNSSVIIEKSPVPVPEYLERADFISLLPNTKV